MTTSFKDLTKVVETNRLADSKALQIQGKNVRGPSLIPNQIYLAKTWKTTVPDSDNVFLVMKFLGSANIKGKERVMYADNPRLIDMKEGDRFLFEKLTDDQVSEIAAYQADDCLCFGDPPVRLTFYAINGVTEQTRPAKNDKRKTDADDTANKGTGSTRVGLKKQSSKKPSSSTKVGKKDAVKPEAEETEEVAANTDGKNDVDENLSEPMENDASSIDANNNNNDEEHVEGESKSDDHSAAHD